MLRVGQTPTMLAVRWQRLGQFGAKLATRYRALSLSSQFGLVAAMILGCGMTLLGSWVTSRIEDGVVKNTAAAAALYLNSFVEPHVQPLAHQDTLPATSTEALDRLVGGADQIKAIKIWGPHGRIIYSTQMENVGKLYPVTPMLARAWQGQIEAEFNKLADVENELERQSSLPLVEVYVPVRAVGTERVIAVAEVYAVYTHLQEDLEDARLQSWLMVGLLTVFMLASLFGIVQRGGRTIREQQEALTLRIAELSDLLAQNKELQARIAEANRRSESNSERFLRRIGAELHDGPAQLVGLALLRLDAIQPLIPALAPHGDPPVIEVIRSALADALKEIRNLSAGLALPEIESASLSEALKIAVRNHERRTGTSVECDLASNLPRQVPTSMTTCLYRFAQEGLNNAFRHAGGAGQKLRASFAHQMLEIEVSDSGIGLNSINEPDINHGLGLSWLSDRIESLGGVLEISSRRNRGTRLIARFRLQ
ncbi:MAG: sensor histidine kinase [Hyphomicrobiaceae bacterium]|nr:sensor histidine kinase [Hyphomicrobiaceae bacterium]